MRVGCADNRRSHHDEHHHHAAGILAFVEHTPGQLGFLMVFFASWGKRIEIVGYAGIEKCQNCKNYCNSWICEHRSEASVYFLRIAKYDKKLLYICEVCEKAWEIDESAKNEAIHRTIGLPSPEECWTIWGRLLEEAERAANANQGNENVLNFVSDALVAAGEELKRTYGEDQVRGIAECFLRFLLDDDKPG
jgi:hypothetical protein